jgi:glucose-6-phosphate 1-dehydrogenase
MSDTHIIGYARSRLTISKLREQFEKHCKVREEERPSFEQFMRHCSYISVRHRHLLFILKIT